MGLITIGIPIRLNGHGEVRGGFFFFSSRRRHTRSLRDWSSDVCSSDLGGVVALVGESGVGKSRLVDDLRTHALVSGCSVVIGGEVAEGGGAYASWQDPLRRIALEATPAAPVPWPFLTLVVQDIGELIGIGQVTTPVMDPQTLQILLMQAVEALIRSVRGPTV